MDRFELSIGTPNCPVCLVPVWPAGSDQHPYWYCPECKVAVIVNSTGLTPEDESGGGSVPADPDAAASLPQ